MRLQSQKKKRDQSVHPGGYNPMYCLGEDSMNELQDAASVLEFIMLHMDEFSSEGRFEVLEVMLARCQTAVSSAVENADFRV